MQAAWLLFLVCFLHQDVPYKANEEFAVKLDYQFKERGGQSTTANTVVYSDKRRDVDGSGRTVLPYVVLKLKILKLNDEDRLKINNNFGDNLLTRKHIEIGKEYVIDLGFTNDIKDRVTANEYTITLSSEDKTPISKIIVLIEANGTFKINGQTRGKF